VVFYREAVVLVRDKGHRGEGTTHSLKKHHLHVYVLGLRHRRNIVYGGGIYIDKTEEREGEPTKSNPIQGALLS
jgi:hypothetical protein